MCSSLEERNQIKELIWTDQSALNNTAMLEEFDVQALEVPKGLYISVQPAEANEIVPIAPLIIVYSVNVYGS